MKGSIKKEDEMVRNVNLKMAVLIIGVLVILYRPSSSYAWDDHRGHNDRYYHYHDHPGFGMRIDFVSNDYVPVMAGGMRYYYYDGLYYAPAGNEYVLVAPPEGAYVPAIPPDYRRIMINGEVYYTDSGVYYIRTRHGYEVVPPPVVRVVPQAVVVEQPEPVRVETPNQTKVVEGAGIGGVLGAVTGGIIGHQMKGHHELGGALIGGAAGAVAGGIVGAQVPNQNAAAPAVTATPLPAAVPMAQGAPGESFTVNVPNSQGGYTPIILRKSGSGFVGPQGEYYTEFPKVDQLKAMYSK
jgi:hypothetical protein